MTLFTAARFQINIVSLTSYKFLHETDFIVFLGKNYGDGSNKIHQKRNIKERKNERSKETNKQTKTDSFVFVFARSSFFTTMEMMDTFEPKLNEKKKKKKKPFTCLCTMSKVLRVNVFKVKRIFYIS